MGKTGISFIIFSVLAVIIAGFSDYSVSYDLNYSNNTNLSINTFESKIPRVLGSTDYGTVFKSGPYGNPDGTQKVAFVVGVHPLEINSHMAMVESIIRLNKSSNYSYYIYNINVTKDRDSYNEGRMNGQILANKFAVPDIIGSNYSLVVDVHSNKGGNFKEEYFLYVPESDDKSMFITHRLIANIPEIVYYTPPYEDGPKSPAYVTIPLINSGIPAVIYETYRYEPYEVTQKHASDFINAVEKLKFG